MEKCSNLVNPQERLSSDDFKLGWLAAMLDGEGSVSIATQVGRKKSDPYFLVPYVCISGSNDESLDRTRQYLKHFEIGNYTFLSSKGGRSIKIKSNITGYATKKCKTIRIWGMKRANKFLKLIQPYLVEKAERANIVIKFSDNRIEKYNNMMRAPGRLKKQWYTWEELELYWKLRKANNTIGKYMDSKSSESIRQATYKLFLQAGKLKMYSELVGDHKRQAEMTCHPT
jgi:hypothetical protein